MQDAHHSIQDEILSVVGDGWITAAELEAKLDHRWTAKFIGQELRDLHSRDLLLRSYEVRSPAIIVALYTHNKRDRSTVMNMVVERRGPAPRCKGCPHAVVLSDPVEAFCADPA